MRAPGRRICLHLITLAVLQAQLGCQPATVDDARTLHVDALQALAQRSLRAGTIAPARLADHGALLGTGWHVKEPTGRWTSSPEAQLVVPLAYAGTAQLELRAAAWGAHEPSKRVTVAVNGFVLPAQEITRELMTTTIDVPNGVLREGDNHVVIACDVVHHVERRDLGVFVEELRFVVDRAPTPPQRDTAAVVLSEVDWIQDVRGALAGADLELRWQSVGPSVDPSAYAELVLVELDAQGRELRDLAAAAVQGDSGTVRLIPPRDVEVDAPCRLLLRSSDPRSTVEIVQAERIVPARDDVLLIVVDTLRADALASYGNPTTDTPHLDRLAAEGTRFHTAVAHAPITGPSHAAIFQSLVPSRAGIVNNHEGRLDPREPTLTEILSAHGYACRSAVSISPILRRFGFARGFDEVDEDIGLAFLRNGAVTTTIAERWLARPGSERPRFTFVHLADPHEPYDAHGTVEAEVRIYLGDVLLARIEAADFEPSLLEFDVEAGAHTLRIESEHILMNRRFELQDTAATGARLETAPPPVVRKNWRGVLRVERAGRVRLAQAINDAALPESELHRRYALEVEAVDRYVGRLLTALEQSGRAERTWVVFTSDHGEELGDHGKVGHVHTLFDEVVRVPLIVRPPTATRGWTARVRDDLAAGVDLMPTLLDLVGIDTPEGRHGRSLRTPSDDDRAVLIETHAPQAKQTQFALRSVQHKIIWAPEQDRWSFFDLFADPREREDLHATATTSFESWRVRLEDSHREYIASQQRAAPAMDADSEAALRSLGYVE